MCCSSCCDFISPLCCSFRCCSDAFHHLHWLHQDVCAVLPVPAQNPHFLPPQLHHDHALRWLNEVKRFPCIIFAKIFWFSKPQCFISLCLFMIRCLEYSPFLHQVTSQDNLIFIPFPSCHFFGCFAFPSHLPFFFRANFSFHLLSSCSLLRLVFVQCINIYQPLASKVIQAIKIYLLKSQYLLGAWMV